MVTAKCKVKIMDVDHLPHRLQPGMVFTRGVAGTGGVELANELLKLIKLHNASNFAAVIIEPISVEQVSRIIRHPIVIHEVAPDGGAWNSVTYVSINGF